jgi:hypothetical protein
MIENDQQLKVTRERIDQFQDWLAQIRQTADARDFETMASGYRLEIERMQAEVMDYLLRPGSSTRAKQPA